MSGPTRPWLEDPAWRAALDEQLAEELVRLRLLLRRQIDWLRQRSGRMPLDGSSPIAVTDADALAALDGPDAAARADFDRTCAQREPIASVEASLHERAAAMHAAGTPFPIDELTSAFGLDAFVRDVLVLALAPELDAAIPRLYAYAQDDASARHATPALALELFRMETAAAATLAFGPGEALTRLAFLAPADGHTGGVATRPLRLDPRVAWFLRGVDDLRSSDGVDLRRVTGAPIPPEFGAAATAVAAALGRSAAGARPPVVNLVGPDPRAARSLAGAIAAFLGAALHSVKIDAEASVPDVVALLDREGTLRRTGFLIDGGDDDQTVVTDVADGCAALVVVASRYPVRLARPAVSVTVPQPAAASRRLLWSQALGPGAGAAAGAAADAIDDALRTVVHHFDLDPESVARVSAAALGAARLRGESVTERDIWQACRVFGRRRLGGLADRIEASFDWDDIVLPAPARTQLEEIAAQVRHRATVYEDWQFAARLPRGRGVTALFAGPSGTGKTMAAEVLARELDLDLYRIDLAGVVNKYIGETEKNLRRIFAAAEESGAILFFDEADALFGKRTDVRDSHDRYANIEIDYLLQRMEAYTGLAILATNRKTALDRAFLRRLRFLVDFPFPAADLRLRIWQKVLPPSAPVERLDFAALAQLDLAGGNIQSIALNAAFLAAADGRVITMDHLLHAAEREYAKLDQAPTETEFGAMTAVAT